MSLVKTVLQDIRAMYPSNLDRDELRLTSDGLLVAVLAMTTAPNSIISPDLREKAQLSEGRLLDVPVMKKGTVTIKNVRSCTFSGGESESDFIRVTWKTIVADITMVPSNYANNEIGYTTDLNKKIVEMVEAFKVEIETDLNTAMDTAKSQVYRSTLIGDEYANVGDAIQVTATQTVEFFDDMSPINFADDFTYSPIKVIGSHRVMSAVSKIEAQRDMNATNTAFAVLGKEFTYSNRITNGAGVKATGYFMPDGSIGLLTRINVDARMNHTAGDGTEWFEDTLPNMPFPVGIQYKSKCDDKSAMQTTGTAHLEATKVEHYQFSFDYGIVTPYNSDVAVNPSAIRKFEFV